MLRRFELYSLRRPRPSASASLEEACRTCGDFIPEVLFSRVGRNRSDAPVDVVWEHAFDSPETYHRYMVHPYHAAVLDRYLLHDSPERVVTDNDLGAGLVGYTCDGPVFEMDGGVRRLVLLRLDRRATPDVVHRLTDTLGRAPAHSEAMVVSVVAANGLGAAWFDAVTPVGSRPRWTHLWEQGFVSSDAFDAYRHGASAPARAERDNWVGHLDGLVLDSVSVHYVLDETPGPGGVTETVPQTQGVQENVSEMVRGRSKVIE